MQLQSTPTGLKETIVLNQPPTPAQITSGEGDEADSGADDGATAGAVEYRYAISASDGLEPRLNGEGEIDFVRTSAPNQAPVFSIPVGNMFDSAETVEVDGQPFAGPAYSSDVAYDLRPTPTPGDNDDDAAGNPFTYVSGYHDRNTGLIKYGTRYYMPILGTWTQPDPLNGSTQNPTSLNKYLYSSSNPVNETDSTGRSDTLDAVAEFAGLLPGCAAGAAIAVAGSAPFVPYAALVFGGLAGGAILAFGLLGGCVGGMALSLAGAEGALDVPLP